MREIQRSKKKTSTNSSNGRLSCKDERQATSCRSFWIHPESTPSHLCRAVSYLSPDLEAEPSWLYRLWLVILRDIYLCELTYTRVFFFNSCILSFILEAHSLIWGPWRAPEEREALLCRGWWRKTGAGLQGRFHKSVRTEWWQVGQRFASSCEATVGPQK